MARYYTEQRGGHIETIVAQDATGLYAGGAVLAEDGSLAIKVARLMPPDEIWIRDMQTGELRSVQNTSFEYLEHRRRYERNPAYTTTVPSEIMEMPGGAEDVIRAVLLRAGPEGVAV